MITSQTFVRSGQFEDLSVDNSRLICSFSSEYPVDRGGGKEILSHAPGACNLERVGGMPFLWNHNKDKVLGVVKQIWTEGGRGYCEVVWSNSEEVERYRQDVADGILTNISFRYSVDETQPRRLNGDYLVTKWTPIEISLVSIPADPSVGIGRQFPDFQGIIKTSREDTGMVSVETVRDEAIATERERVAVIGALGARHGLPDLATQLIERGTEVEEARALFLERIATATPATPVAAPVNPLGLTDKEQNQYSLVRALSAVITGDWSKAGFERECSLEIAKQAGKDPVGFYVPVRDLKVVQQRDPYAVGANATGGYTVQTDLLSQNFIDLLRNKTRCIQLGAMMLSGLQGNVDIPKQATASTTYWVAENGEITESEATFGQVTLRPKTIAARSQMSRLILKQSSIDIEQFIRNDFAQVIALGIDLAIIKGTGTSGQPTGILNTNGIGSVAIGTDGGAPTWASIVGLETEVAIDNADEGKLAYLTNAKVRGKLKTVLKSNSSVSEFIWRERMSASGTDMVNGYRADVSNQVPSNLTKGNGSNLSAIIFGNWGDVIIGEWGVMEILPNPYGSGYTSGAVDLRVMQTLDIILRRPESFAACTDLVTT